MDREQQKKEIKTVKERNITIKLSDVDCERISNLCGKHNITVSNLLECFIGDLICGTYTNGSDERDLAEQWFERCGFGRFSKPTLLKYILDDLYLDVDDVIFLVDEIEDIKNDLEKYEQNPKDFDEEEIGFAKSDLEDYEQRLEEIKSEFFKTKENANWEEELKEVKKYAEEKMRFLDGE